MQLTDQVRINAPRDKVFESLNDQDVLRQAIPGCEALEKTSDNVFTATVVTKIGPMKVKFKGGVELSNIVPPESYTLSGKGMGGTQGFAKIRADITLNEDDSVTVLKYDVKVDVGGKLAQLGGRMIEGTSKKRAADFFENFEAIVGEGRISDVEPDSALPSDSAAASASSGIPNSILWLAAALGLGAVLYYIA